MYDKKETTLDELGDGVFSVILLRIVDLNNVSLKVDVKIRQHTSQREAGKMCLFRA
jgi:hypothetical protein